MCGAEKGDFFLPLRTANHVFSYFNRKIVDILHENPLKLQK
ncbi:hypothetical protein B4129_3507 [Bacillus safensis]|nr:hypothetical protein B4129_3507 [Bacillus safensis]